jgi:hypothetical protein
MTTAPPSPARRPDLPTGPLVTWRADRITRRAHTAALAVVTVALLVGGVFAIPAIVDADPTLPLRTADGLVVIALSVWGFSIAAAALAYYQGRIAR